MRKYSMALRHSLSLRKPRSGCLEGRTTLVHSIVDPFARSKGQLLSLSVPLLLLLAPTGAIAQLGAARQACAADLKHVCAEVKPGEGRLKTCVKEHFAQLSAACQTALIANVTITKSCKADADKKCRGIQPGGGLIQACMKDHFTELTADCKEALLLAKLQQQ
jgi:cysteine rich repeat protein